MGLLVMPAAGVVPNYFLLLRQQPYSWPIITSALYSTLHLHPILLDAIYTFVHHCIDSRYSRNLAYFHWCYMFCFLDFLYVNFPW